MIPKEHIYTYTGKAFSPFEPQKSDICPQDIAHALSLMCRANGHFTHFYSVAQHCLACEREAQLRGLSDEIRLGCLLHDASEAYLSDITRPVKLRLEEYRSAEKHLQGVIYSRFGLEPDENALEQIAGVDDAMLYSEFLELGGLALFETPPVIISRPDFSFVEFSEAERLYLSTLDRLCRKIGCDAAVV